MDMGMPKPTAEHQRLERLAGVWRGTETLHPSPWDPKGGTAEGRIRSRLALGGFYLITDYEQWRDGQRSFDGHGVYGYDAQVRAYTMNWFDCMGMEGGVRVLGAWNGDVLEFRRESPMGHSRYVYEPGPGTYRFRLEHSRDGSSWACFMDGTYRRED